MSGGNAHLLSNVVDAQTLVQTAQSTLTQSKVSRLPTATTSSSASSAMGVLNPVHAARTDSRTNHSSFDGSKQSHAASSINDPSNRSSSNSGSGNVYGEYHERASNTYAVLIRDELNQLVSSLRSTEQGSVLSRDNPVDDIVEPISVEKGSEEEKEKELENWNESNNNIDKMIVKEVLQSIVDIVSSRCGVGNDVGVDEIELCSEGEMKNSVNPAPIPSATLSSSTASSSSSSSVNSISLSASSIAVSPTSTTLPPSDTTADSAALPPPHPVRLPLPPTTAIATYWGHAELSDPVNGQNAVTATTSSSSSSSASSTFSASSTAAVVASAASASAPAAYGSASPPPSSSSLASLPLTLRQSSHLEIDSHEYSTSTPHLVPDSTSILPERPRMLDSMTDLSMVEEVELIESERRRGKITLLDHLYLQDECGLGLYVHCVSDSVLQGDPPSFAKLEGLQANLCDVSVLSKDGGMCVQDGNVETVDESGGLDSVVTERMEELIEERVHEVVAEMVEREVNEKANEKVEKMEEAVNAEVQKKVEEGADEMMDAAVSAGSDINDKAVYVEVDVEKNESEDIVMDQKVEIKVREDGMEVELKGTVKKKEEEQQIDDNENNAKMVVDDMNMNIGTAQDVNMDVNIDVNADVNGCDAEVAQSVADADADADAEADMNPQSQYVLLPRDSSPFLSPSPSLPLSLSPSPSANTLENQSDQSRDFNDDVIQVSNSCDRDTHIQEKENTSSDTQPSSPTPHASTYWKDISYVPINSKTILVRVGDSLSQRTFPSTVSTLR